MPDASLRDAVRALMPRARADLAELVAFRSVADPQQFPPSECERAAAWVVDAFAAEGLQDVRAWPTDDGSLAVAGRAEGPPGSPTALLYSHYDVQPPMGEDAWASPVWELTERDERWYGRGTADCKGSVVMHLTALRALRERHGGALPCTVKVICEGSEEQGTGGLEALVPREPQLLEADAILIADSGNVAVGVPTLTTTLRGMALVEVRLQGVAGALHSGSYGGAAPDPIAGLVAMLASLVDERGDATVDGLASDQTWAGSDYPAEQFRQDAGVLDGVGLMGSGSVADMLWARPAVTVLGMDVPPVVGATASVQPSAAARVSLRVPPGIDARDAEDLLVAHLERRVPWGLRCEIRRAGVGQPFGGSDGPAGPARRLLGAALQEAYGRELVTVGQGGSIPLCSALAAAYPQAEILLFGVAEPACRIHAPNESVDPGELERVALAEALFLERFGATGGA